jgi:hypothetical protein
MGVVNQIIGRLFDAVMILPAKWPPLAGLAVMALLVAAAVLLLFRATSNQSGITAAKRRMQAGLYEIRLLNDDPRCILRAFQDILWQDLKYVRYSIVPLLWMLVPLTLVIAQLQSFYACRPLEPGTTFLVTAQMAARTPARPALELQVPAGLRVETAGAWLRGSSQVMWRVRAENPGQYAIQVLSGAEPLAKQVRVGGGVQRLSPRREQPRFWGQVLEPGESPLPKGQAVQSIHVTYTSRDVGVGRLRGHWLIAFFVLVLGFGLLLKGRFKVAF